MKRLLQDLKQNWRRVFLCACLSFFVSYNIIQLFMSFFQKEITFQECLSEFVEPRKVDFLEVGGISGTLVLIHLQETFRSSSNYTYYAYWFRIGNAQIFEQSLQTFQHDMGIPMKEFIKVKYNFVLEPMWYFVVFIISGSIGLFISDIMNEGKIQKPLVEIQNLGKTENENQNENKNERKSSITFDHIAGMKQVKMEVQEFTDFLKNPERFTKLGAKIPKGLLLVGPPGVGKTLLAKAIAGESKVSFFFMSGSDFVEMYVGVGAKRVRQLFQKARANAPSIIFIDEIDSLGRSRSDENGGSREYDHALNQLLVEMDGFTTSSDKVLVMAGTNRHDIMDSALLRPGRFDRIIEIPKPDLEDRIQILLFYLQKLQIQESAQTIATKLAQLMSGSSGASLETVCNEAAIFAARKDKEIIEWIDFEQAFDRITTGMKKEQIGILNQEERKRIAYHEAGHTICAWFSKFSNPILKVTIVARTSGALGLNQFLSTEQVLYHKEQLFDQMVIFLGGRAAEELIFSNVSTGAVDDLQKVHKIASTQILRYGMSKSLGPVYFQEDQKQTFILSEATKQKIEKEIQELIQDAYAKAKAILLCRQEYLEKVANALLEKETLDQDALKEIFDS